MKIQSYDKLIIGSGFYGLYAALFCGKSGQHVLLIEKESAPFLRASYINQARVHMGYHYPRSLTTAVKSARYFERFCSDFKDCINTEFEQIYAIGERFSWTTAAEFKAFCKNAEIPCEEVDAEKYFRRKTCEGVFRTREYSFDAHMIRDKLISAIGALSNVSIFYSCHNMRIEPDGDLWRVEVNDRVIETPFILNAAYASVNEIHKTLGFEPFKIKYEKCEIILCDVNEELTGIGLTVMDGPFFSLMPFGKSGMHSLTSVSFTPHETSYDALPTFECQNRGDGNCSPANLANCNDCIHKPQSAWDYMSQLTRKYIDDKYNFFYHDSLFVIKPILQSSEIDDSRPTVIKMVSQKPQMVSVLSGKINTIYDMDEVLS